MFEYNHHRIALPTRKDLSVPCVTYLLTLSYKVCSAIPSRRSDQYLSQNLTDPKFDKPLKC